MKKFALLLIFLLSACSTKEVREQTPPWSFGGFDGVWEGRLYYGKNLLYPFETYPKDLRIKIAIKSDKVNVYLFSNDEWDEITPGLFRIETHKSNAVIFALNSSKDVPGRGGWVETWNFTLTHRDNESAHVFFVRAVNNYLLKPDHREDNKAGRFIYSYNGTLNRS